MGSAGSQFEGGLRGFQESARRSHKEEEKPSDQEAFHASSRAHGEAEDAFEDEGFKTLRKNQELGATENSYAFLSWKF